MVLFYGIEALKEAGFESGTAAIQQLGFKGAIEAVINTTDGSVESLGKLFISVEAIKGVLGLTGASADRFAGALEEMGVAGGATEIAFAKMSATFSNQFKLLRNILNVGLIDIGERILPTLTVIISEIAAKLSSPEVQSKIAMFAELIGKAFNTVLNFGKQLLTNTGAVFTKLKRIFEIFGVKKLHSFW